MGTLIIAYTLPLILTGSWLEDFWEHAAVARSLAENPVSPKHPIINIDKPHPFFSPFSLAVGLLSRLTGVHSVVMLSVFAIVNLIFLFWAFKWFLKATFSVHTWRIAFFALLFILFFWGWRPWFWSSFFHIWAINFVAPYPSTFAVAMTFAGLGCLLRYLEEKGLGYLVGYAAIIPVVVITHPTTALFLLCGSAGIVFGNWNRNPRDLALIVLAGILGTVLVFLWPYYSFVDLITANTTNFHTDSITLYDGILQNTFLSLPGIVIILLNIKQKNHQALGIAIALMLIIYIYGYASRNYGYGRVISFMVMLAHIASANWVVQLTSRKKQSKLKIQLVYTVLIAVFLIGSPLLRSAWKTTSNALARNGYEKYFKLEPYCGPDKLFFSNFKTSWRLPAFGCKVIASDHPLYWIPDHEQRRLDMVAFFRKNMTGAERLEILRKYDVDYMLIDFSYIQANESVIQWMNSLGKTILHDEDFMLVELKI